MTYIAKIEAEGKDASRRLRHRLRRVPDYPFVEHLREVAAARYGVNTPEERAFLRGARASGRSFFVVG